MLQSTEMDNIDLEQFGFVRLTDFTYPGNVTVYEFNNHNAVDGSHDFHRLNLYMSRDGEFITIWFGLLAPEFIEFPEKLKDAGLDQTYYESLFRGYPENQSDLGVILRALRVNGSSYKQPQVLKGLPTDIRCELLT